MKEREDPTLLRFTVSAGLGRAMPIVTVALQPEGANLSIDAIVDSGASLSVLHSDFAGVLGIPDVTKGQAIRVIGTGESFYYGFAIDVFLRYPKPFQLGPALLYFSSTHSLKGVLCLGHEHLQAFHRVVFDFQRRRFWTSPTRSPTRA